MSIKLALRQQLSKFEDQINSRSLRERVLLLTSAVVVLFFLWKIFIFSYLSASTDQIMANKERLSTQINSMQGQISNLSETIKNDSMTILEQNLKISISQNLSMKEKINQRISELITSGEMISVLKGFLSEEENLKIEKIESLDDKPMFSDKSEVLLYNKGVQLEIEGDYIATVIFLENLERSNIKILWDSLIYEVTQYPLAKIIITVHTIGTEKGWLHV